jgi:hypothetical protein
MVFQASTDSTHIHRALTILSTLCDRQGPRPQLSLCEVYPRGEWLVQRVVPRAEIREELADHVDLRGVSVIELDTNVTTVAEMISCLASHAHSKRTPLQDGKLLEFQR